MMKKFLLLTVLLLPMFTYSQDSLFRVESPVAAKIGFSGVGLDVELGNRFGFDATTWILSSSFSARYYILEKNGTPFIGVGVGKFNGGFGGGSENQYTVGFAGWEHSYKVFLIQIAVQLPLYRKYSYGFTPFIVNLNLGARI